MAKQIKYVFTETVYVTIPDETDEYSDFVIESVEKLVKEGCAESDCEIAMLAEVSDDEIDLDV